jgi:hypothetical protein
MVAPDAPLILDYNPAVLCRRARFAVVSVVLKQRGSFPQVQRKLLGKALSLLHHHDKQERR